jgi:hypothetical protein
MNFPSLLAPICLLLLAGCATAPPPIADGIHGLFSEMPEKFDRRVRERFPVGSDEARLHQELLRERFVITRNEGDPFRYSANFASSDMACRIDWTIRWSQYAGKIAEITATEGHVCL